MNLSRVVQINSVQIEDESVKNSSISSNLYGSIRMKKMKQLAKSEHNIQFTCNKPECVRTRIYCERLEKKLSEL